jgi:hypothetical protein
LHAGHLAIERDGAEVRSRCAAASRGRRGEVAVLSLEKRIACETVDVRRATDATAAATVAAIVDIMSKLADLGG